MTKGSKKEENALQWYYNAQTMPGRAVRDLDALYNKEIWKLLQIKASPYSYLQNSF